MHKSKRTARCILTCVRTHVTFAQIKVSDILRNYFSLHLFHPSPVAATSLFSPFTNPFLFCLFVLLS